MRTRINGVNVTHINSETGEVICETNGCTEIHDGTLTEKEKERLEYLATHDMHFNKNTGFVKMYVEAVWILAQKLPTKEFSVVMLLSKFVEYETCILRTGYGKGKHDMDLQEIADAIGVDYTRASRLIRSLISKGIIGEFRAGDINSSKITKKYLVNPYIYCNGSHPETDVIKYFFEKTGWVEFIECVH